MDFILQPWQFYFLVLAGWVHRQQQEVIAYLRTENQVLKEKLGKKRILLNDDQRRRLESAANQRVGVAHSGFLGRRVLASVDNPAWRLIQGPMVRVLLYGKYSVRAPGRQGNRDSGSDEYVEDFLYDLQEDPYERNNLVADPALAPVARNWRKDSNNVWPGLASPCAHSASDSVTPPLEDLLSPRVREMDLSRDNGF